MIVNANSWSVYVSLSEMVLGVQFLLVKATEDLNSYSNHTQHFSDLVTPYQYSTETVPVTFRHLGLISVTLWSAQMRQNIKTCISVWKAGYSVLFMKSKITTWEPQPLTSLQPKPNYTLTVKKSFNPQTAILTFWDQTEMSKKCPPSKLFKCC